MYSGSRCNCMPTAPMTDTRPFCRHRSSAWFVTSLPFDAAQITTASAP